MSKSTPGPWKVVPELLDGDTFAIDDETRANALLIATAPDLLDALVKLSNEVLGSMSLVEPSMRREIGNTNYNLLIQRAEEARVLIAKATGA